MWLAEVLPRYPALRRRLHQTIAAVAAEAPAALVTIDSPDFCLRVARGARAARPGLRTIHYVAPSVWAWRPGRAAKMARVIDHVLALLPFEPPYMTAAGMSCDFVGHPIAAEPQAGPAEVAAFRAAQGIAADAPVVLALPGSRMGEVTRMGPRFGAALERVAAMRPGLRVVVPTVRGVAGGVRELAAGWPGAPVVIEAGIVSPEVTRAAFASGRAALAASGTVSLDLAAAGVPMVIGWDAHWLTRAILKRMIRVDTVTLVNLVSETRAVPELLGPACTPEALARALAALLEDGPTRAAQLDAMALTMKRLGRGSESPGLRAARSVLGRLDRGEGAQR
jgi:lipid-A-disaccharide synthase